MNIENTTPSTELDDGLLIDIIAGSAESMIEQLTEAARNTAKSEDYAKLLVGVGDIEGGTGVNALPEVDASSVVSQKDSLSLNLVPFAGNAEPLAVTLDAATLREYISEVPYSQEV